jgi:hypothetical protein
MMLRSAFVGFVLSAALLAVGCSCCHKKPACSTCPPPPIPPPPAGTSSGFDSTTVPALPNTPPYVSGTTR